jgi:hypothetical protein
VLRPPRARIGRSRDNDIVLADHDGAASSARHAEALRAHGQWVVTDLQSSNGTWLNGSQITRAPFGPGDRLRFGDVECEVLRSRFWGTAAVAAGIVLAVVTVTAYLLTDRRSPDFERVATDIARSVYLVAADTGAGRQIIGTAFVVAPGLLATNAHVAQALDVSPSQTSRRALVIRGDSGETNDVTAVHMSSAWREGSIADDVAILRVINLAADAPPLRLADTPRLQSLARGVPLATFGFPAMSTDPLRPRGRLSTDVLGDVRDGRYLAVGLRIAPGTSGSPIFLRDGTVVGLVAGGDFMVSASGDQHPSGTNVNWGISIAPLRQLLRECTGEQR